MYCNRFFLLIFITYFCGFLFQANNVWLNSRPIVIERFNRLKSLPPEVLAFQWEQEEFSRSDRLRYIAHWEIKFLSVTLRERERERDSASHDIYMWYIFIFLLVLQAEDSAEWTQHLQGKSRRGKFMKLQYSFFFLPYTCVDLETSKL